MVKPLSVYLIAGEASGDLLGAGLIEALKRHERAPIAFSGIGGERMQAAGLKSLFPYHELSLMGFAEIVPHMVSLLARIHQTVEDIITKQPDVVITIDSPGFNFRVAARLRREGLKHTKLVHYVAPTVWAYKPKRAARCAELFDAMLCLLPFEPPFFEAEGMAARFVGHPVAAQPLRDGAAFRAQHGLTPDQPVLLMMPGSREGEIRRHLPIFAQAVQRFSAVAPELALLVPVAARLLPMLAPYFEGCPYRAVLLGDPAVKWDAFAASDLALIKSGTSSLEVARAGVPQVVAFRTGKLTAAIARRLITVEQVSLVNILLEQEIIPEFIQERCTAPHLADALGALWQQPELRQRQRAMADTAVSLLQAPGGEPPSDAAAQAVLGCLRGDIAADV